MRRGIIWNNDGIYTSLGLVIDMISTTDVNLIQLMVCKQLCIAIKLRAL